MTVRWEKLLILSGALSAAIYFSAFTLLFAARPEYSITNNYISELGAQDSPVKTMTNIGGFFLPGIFFVLFGIATYRRLNNTTPGIIGALLLTSGGLLYTAIALTPCDPGCQNSSTLGKWHEFLSDGSLYLGSSSIIFIAAGIAKHSHKTAAKALLGIILILTAMSGGATYLYLHTDSNVGELMQKIAIGIPFAIMGTASLYLYTERPLKNRTAQLLPQQKTIAWASAIILIATILTLTSRDTFQNQGPPGQYQETLKRP